MCLIRTVPFRLSEHVKHSETSCIISWWYFFKELKLTDIAIILWSATLWHHIFIMGTVHRHFSVILCSSRWLHIKFIVSCIDILYMYLLIHRHSYRSINCKLMSLRHWRTEIIMLLFFIRMGIVSANASS